MTIFLLKSKIDFQFLSSLGFFVCLFCICFVFVLFKQMYSIIKNKIKKQHKNEQKKNLLSKSVIDGQKL